jgi:hypothetical protein
MGNSAPRRSCWAGQPGRRYLFSEFNRLRVLESQFFENDSAFNACSKLSPDPMVHSEFEAALDHAQSLAHARLN